jgi:hypothetical protein
VGAQQAGATDEAERVFFDGGVRVIWLRACCSDFAMDFSQCPRDMDAHKHADADGCSVQLACEKGCDVGVGTTLSNN